MPFFVFLRLIKKYITSYRWLALFLLSGHIFEAGFDSGMRMSLKFIIDEAIVPKNYSLLVLILLLLSGGVIAVTFIGLLGDFFGARFSVMVINDIRRSLFERVQSLSMEFFGRRSAGDIVNCSTIVNLLARFYDPDSGRILFDGIDLRSCTVFVMDKGCLVVSG